MTASHLRQIASVAGLLVLWQLLVQTGKLSELFLPAPLSVLASMTTAEVEIGDKRIPRDSVVVSVIGAANRDPKQFADPDRLDVSRKDNRHIAFGFGIHFCLGAHLARLEGQIALGTLLRRMPKLALVSDVPKWRESSTLRGLKSLPVTF